jgi:WD40 repeat protein
MQTGNLAEGPLHRHTKKISSVAHSRDDNCIVFGFYDHTIWISNVETGDVVVGPLEGHTGGVKSVVFSHDGRHIVSSSDDHTYDQDLRCRNWRHCGRTARRTHRCQLRHIFT